jgi:hypothetical protein
MALTQVLVISTYLKLPMMALFRPQSPSRYVMNPTTADRSKIALLCAAPLNTCEKWMAEDF